MTSSEMEKILTEVAQHVRQLQTDVHSMGDRLGFVEGRLGGVESRLGRVEDRLDGVEARLSGVETRVTSIDGHVKNLDRRTTNIEEILPTLATKEDLRLVEERLETRLGARIEDARRESRVLFEDVRGDIRMLAEHVAGLAERRERNS